MENTKQEFTNIDEKVLEEVITEDTLKCIDNEKLMKRLMVSSLGEIISTLDTIDKNVNVVSSLISIAYKDDIDDYFKAVAKNVRAEEKRIREAQEKNDIDNKQEIN